MDATFRIVLLSVATVFFALGIVMQIKSGPIARMLQKNAWGYGGMKIGNVEKVVRVTGAGFSLVGFLMAVAP